jgi:hypothetical protein
MDKMPETGGIAAMNIGSIQSITFLGTIGFILLSVLLLGIACTGTTQSPPEADTNEPGKVLGIAFNTVTVSNLERSIEYYQAIGFTPVGETNPPWIEDEAANRLYNTPGAKSRTASMTINSTAS